MRLPIIRAFPIRPLEQIGEPNPLCRSTEVIAIQAVALSDEHATDVSPLAIGHLSELTSAASEAGCPRANGRTETDPDCWRREPDGAVRAAVYPDASGPRTGRS